MPSATRKAATHAASSLMMSNDTPPFLLESEERKAGPCPRPSVPGPLPHVLWSVLAVEGLLYRGLYAVGEKPGGNCDRYLLDEVLNPHGFLLPLAADSYSI